MRTIVMLGLCLCSLLPAASAQALRHTDRIDAVLRDVVERGAIPGVVAMVADPDRVLYHAAFGKRVVSSNIAMTEDTIFRIASMTKPITSVAAMQLVEQGRLSLDEPIKKYLPAFASPKILTGFQNGEPQFKPAVQPIVVRQLLTHTSGLAYTIWDKNLREYESKRKGRSPENVLVFEPGAKWEYGTSTDELGRLVEAVSGLSLDEYFKRYIFQPLTMDTTFFNIPAADADRVTSRHQRQADGSLHEAPRRPPTATSTFEGGGGLASTAADYVKFMQMILNRGAAEKARILKNGSVDAMTQNQIGDLDAGRLKSVDMQLSNDVDFHPGFNDKFGFGFLINPTRYNGGRAAGSLAWAGLHNTYFWIDPERKLCALILMQILPFVDHKAMALLRDFETAVYASASR